MDTREMRVRLIEAATKIPHGSHHGGHAAGVLETAQGWSKWVDDGGDIKQRETLGLPKKDK